MDVVLTVFHSTTCLSDYILVHRNGDHEALVGLYLRNQTPEEAAQQLVKEVMSLDKLPEEVKDDDIRIAAEAAVEGVDFTELDADGNPLKDGDEIEKEVRCHTGDEPLAWFVVQWTYKCASCGREVDLPPRSFCKTPDKHDARYGG